VRLAPLDDDDFHATIRPDVPRGDRTGEAYDQSTEQCWPKSGNDELIQQCGNESEHRGVQHQHEEPQGDQGDRKRQDVENWPDDAVDEAQKNGCQNERPGPGNRHTGNETGSQKQPQHSNQRS